ncbi:MAG: carboxypeptidase-like regulatory domain-containing protein [Candidatus Tyrphobacter sp.]
MRALPVVLGFVLLLGADGGGCSQSPHVVGVQEYGSVTGRVLDATSNLPIANAIVSVGSLFTASTDGQGAFVISRVPVGQQSVSVRAPAYTTVTTNVVVAEDEGTSVGYVRLVPIAMPAGMTTLPPPSIPSMPPATAPPATATPAPTQTP